MLNDAARNDLIRTNPIKEIRKLPLQQKDFKFWTQAEATAFLLEAKKHDLWDYRAFFIALSTGLRLGEVAGLKWDCIDFQLNQITIKRTWCQKERRIKETTKTKQIRRVPINTGLRRLLEEARSDSTTDTVFPKEFDSKNLTRKVKSIAKAAQVPEQHFHALRHSFASMWMMAGNAIYDLQKVLGHSTITMTERYSHLSPSHLVGKTEFLQLAG